MKRQILLSAAAAILLGAPAAHAEGWYLGVLGGPSFDPHTSVNGAALDTDTGYNLGLRAGMPLGDATPTSGLALEGDFFYTRAGLSGLDAHESSESAMADLVYHLDTGTPIGIYGGGGVGVMRTGYDNAAISGAGTRLGWQALGGIEYHVSPETSLFAEYRYHNAPDIHVGGAPVSDLTDNVSFGVKFNM